MTQLYLLCLGQTKWNMCICRAPTLRVCVNSQNMPSENVSHSVQTKNVSHIISLAFSSTVSTLWYLQPPRVYLVIPDDSVYNSIWGLHPAWPRPRTPHMDGVTTSCITLLDIRSIHTRGVDTWHHTRVTQRVSISVSLIDTCFVLSLRSGVDSFYLFPHSLMPLFLWHRPRQLLNIWPNQGMHKH